MEEHFYVVESVITKRMKISVEYLNTVLYMHFLQKRAKIVKFKGKLNRRGLYIFAPGMYSSEVARHTHFWGSYSAGQFPMLA